MLNIFRVPKNNCPHCDKPMNRMGTPDPETEPVPGAFVMCMQCGKLSVINEDMTLRVITAEELTIFMLDDHARHELEEFARFAHYKKKVEAAPNN